MPGVPVDSLAHRPLTPDERRYYREWSLIALVSLATLVLFIVMQWGQSPGFAIFDQFQRWWPAHPGNDIVVVEVDDHTLHTQNGWPINRTVYAELLRKLADSDNRPTAIGFDILFPDPRPEDVQLAEQMHRHRVYLATERPRIPGQTSSEDRLISPVLAEAARGLAHVNLSFEKDGSLRGTHLIEQGVPQLALAMTGLPLRHYTSANSYRRLDMVNPQEGFPSASLADVLAGQVPLEFFKGKYVLIGSTAPSLGDHFPTLYAGQRDAGTPGVMLHANLLDNILHDQLIDPVPLWAQIALSCAGVGAALLALLVLSPLAELVVNIGIALCLLALSFGWLGFGYIWFDPGLCVIAIALLKPAWAWRRNEMIVRFMSERAAALESGHRPRKNLRNGLRLRHFTSDTLLQYSRVLDKAIGVVSNRLGFLQRLVDQVPVAMLVADDAGKVLLVNPSMQHILPAELVRQGQGLQALLAYLGLASPNLDTLTTKDHLVSSQDERHGSRHFVLRVAPIDEGGDKPLWVVSLADVTEMRQFQAQRDRTLQLLSHDMRTPIAAIIALSRQSIPADPGSEMTAGIHRHASTLLGMMDDFIYAIQAQAPRYKRVEMLLDDLLDDALYQIKDLARAKGMRLALELDDDPQFVLADQRLLTRVLSNLLVNAVRHGEAGTDIHIRITHDPVSALQPSVRCRISNTVGGATNAPANTAGNSFGLGLDFVKTVVQKHDGHIQLNLHPPGGSTASVELALPIVR